MESFNKDVLTGPRDVHVLSLTFDMQPTLDKHRKTLMTVQSRWFDRTATSLSSDEKTGSEVLLGNDHSRSASTHTPHPL